MPPIVRAPARDPPPDPPGEVGPETVIRAVGLFASVRRVPIAPAPTPWAFPPCSTWDPDDDLVALGADLEPGTLVTAYGLGLFPMPVTLDGEEHLGWFSPVERGVLPLDGLRVSRSLRRVRARLRDPHRHRLRRGRRRVRQPGPARRLDHAGVRGTPTAACTASAGPTPSRPGATTGSPAGSTASASAGSSPGSRCSTASATPRRSRCWRSSTCSATGTPTGRLLDVQWQTPHLESLGVVRRPRAEYLDSLERSLDVPLPEPFRVDD